MSTTAEDVSTTLTQEERANLSSEEQIAHLLIDEDESEREDDTGEETQTEASTQSEDEESNEASAESEEQQQEQQAASDDDEEVTWGNVLGLRDDQMSFDDDGNLNGFITKVNGETTTISAEELLAGFQNNKANTTKAQEHAEAVKNFEVQMEQSKQEYVSKLESVEALSKHFERQLIAEYDDVNWAQLKDDNPAQYAAMRLDFQNKAGELQQILDAIEKDKQAEFVKHQEGMVEKQQAYVKQQFDLLIQNNPEWADKTKRDAAQAEFRTFVSDQYGFTDAEFDTVFDARLIELIKDAKRYHDASKVASKKRQTPVPKFQKSVGGQKQKAPNKLDKLTKAIPKARGAEKRDLQATAVAELLMGNE